MSTDDHRAPRRAHLPAAAAGLGVTVLFAPAAADAATFQVTSAADDGAGSLREAITAANAASGADTITFASSVTGDIDLATALAAITEALTLDGPGASALRIDGNAHGTVLTAQADLTVEGLTVTGGSASGIVADNPSGAMTLLVDHATVSGSSSTGSGGGIRSAGEAVTVRDSLITGNTESAGGSAGRGGGIGMDGGALTMTDSTVTQNTATSVAGSGGGVGLGAAATADIRRSQITSNTSAGKGGGIGARQAGAMTLVDTVVSGNTATSRGGGLFLYRGAAATLQTSRVTGNTVSNGRGGGIMFYVPSGANVIDRTAVDGNQATGGFGRGGGIMFYRSGAGASLDVTRSSLSGNSATANGGGLFLYKGSAAVEFENSTIADNSAGSSGGAIFTRGPFSAGASLDLTSSTVAANAASSGTPGVDLSGAVPAVTIQNSILADNGANDLTGGSGTLAAGFSLVENTAATFTSTTGPNTLGVDPQLGALADNGGPTRTKRPAGTSPVVDGGNANGLLVDQRGRTRPFDLPSVGSPAGGDTSDIGAFELQGGTLTITNLSPSSPSSDRNPVLKGTVPDAVTTVRIFENAACSGPGVGSGTPTAFATSGIAATLTSDGARTLFVGAFDGSGNLVACTSTGVPYTLDTTAPTLPGFDRFNPASPGASTTPRIFGFAESAATVKVFTSAACTGAPVATGTGADFSTGGLLLPAVAAGSTTSYYVTATDAAGNVSGCAGPFAYTQDSTAPAAPTLSAVAPLSPANDNTPRLRGSAEAGSVVRIYKTADCSGAAFASGPAADFNGSGIVLPPVADNSTTTFYATATDQAGNVSACSAGIEYVEDSSAPAGPTLSGFTPASPSTSRTPKLVGTAEAGSSVAVYADADCTGTPLATGTAAELAAGLQLPTLPANAATELYVTATDAAGNVSRCAGPRTYVHDDAAPAAPVLGSFAPGSPANDNAPRLRGTADAGTTVRIFTTADCSGAPVASGSAAAFASPGIALSVTGDTATTFYAVAEDAAGNVSACSSGLEYVEDSTAPAVPALTGFSPASPANANAPRVRGTADAGTTVRVYDDAACTGTPVASGSAAAFASPGLELSVADDSATTFYAVAVDAAGNVSGCSAGLEYVEDSSAPATPVLTAFGPASSSNAPMLRGSAEPGASVRVYTNASCTGVPVATGTAAELGGAGIALAVADDTTTSFWAVAVDASGNVSACAGPVTYVEDSTTPVSGVTTAPGSPANDNAPRLVGTAEAGATVRVYGTPRARGRCSRPGRRRSSRRPGSRCRRSPTTPPRRTT